MKFCAKCGKELFDEAVICPGCGCPAPAPHQASVQTQPIPADLLPKLSERVKTNGIIWLIIGALQILLGIGLMSLGASFDMFLLIVGVLNIITSVNDMKYSRTVLQNPTGIVKRFEPLTTPIITMIYNLVIGGIIGVIGSIYYLVAIRNLVMENKQAFLSMEQREGGNVI